MTQGQLIPWGGTFLTLAFLPISLCDDLRNLFLPLLSADAPSLTFYMKLNPISSSSPPPWRSRRSFCMYSAKATFACRRLRARPRARQRQTNWTRRKVVSGETFLCKRPRPKSSNGEGEGCGKCQGAIQSTAQDVRIEEAFPNRGLPRRGGASHGRTNERRHWVRSLHTSLLFVRAMFSRFDDSSQCKNMTKYSSDEVRYISFYKCYSRQNSATIIFASYNSVKLMRQNQVIQFRGRVNKWRDRGGGRRRSSVMSVMSCM